MAREITTDSWFNGAGMVERAKATLCDTHGALGTTFGPATTVPSARDVVPDPKLMRFKQEFENYFWPGASTGAQTEHFLHLDGLEKIHESSDAEKPAHDAERPSETEGLEAARRLSQEGRFSTQGSFEYHTGVTREATKSQSNMYGEVSAGPTEDQVTFSVPTIAPQDVTSEEISKSHDTTTTAEDCQSEEPA